MTELTGDLVRTPAPPDRAAADYRRRGWRVGRIEANDREGFLVGVGEALGFPSYYGANLDALWDCLTDLTRPTALVWSGWQDLAVADPDEWAKVMAVLSLRVDRSPAFTVVLAGS